MTSLTRAPGLLVHLLNAPRLVSVPLSLVAVLAALFLCVALSGRAQGATIPWSNSAGGSFNVPANWNSGLGPVPVAADIAQFNIANTYATTFNLSPTNTTLNVGGSTVSFRPDTVASRTYTITSNATITGGSLTLAAPTSGANTLALNIATSLTVNSGRSLAVNAGNDISSATFNLATTAAGTATTTIDGTGSTMTVTGATAIGLNGGVGSLTLQNNASASFGAISVANSGVASSGGSVTVQSGADITALGNVSLGESSIAGQVSTFIVTGSGSSVVQTGAATLAIGATGNSSATLDISSSGAFTTGTGVTSINNTGQLNINGGTLNANGDIGITGGSLTRSSGTFNWAASNTLNVQAGGDLNFTGSYSAPVASIINLTGAGSQLTVTSGNLLLNGGAALSVNGGANATVSGFLDVSTAGGGSVLVDGTGSTLSASALGTNLLGSFGTGTFTVRSSASATVVGGFTIGLNSGSNGSLNVESGATLTTGSISIATGGTTATGNVSVSAATLTQTGASTLTVGAASLSTATVVIGSGAYTTGTGLTTVNPTGSIFLSGGTLNLKGNITVTDGQFIQSGGVLNWDPSRTMTIQSAGTIELSESFLVPNGATINVTGTGSQLTMPSAVLTTRDATVNISASGSLEAETLTLGTDVGRVSVLTVDGAGSTVAVYDIDNSIGTNGGTATASFTNNALGAFSLLSNVYVGRSASSGGASGTLNVLSGADVNLGTLIISDGTTTTGTVTIDGAGSSITQGGTGLLRIGSAAGSPNAGQLVLNTGGIFIGGTGGVSVNRSGRLNMTGGTFNANGNISVTGGTLTQTGGTFNWAASRSLSIQSGATVNLAAFLVPNDASIVVDASQLTLANSISLNGGSDLTVTNGADVIATNFLDIATSGDGTVLVDGAGSTLNVGGGSASYLGADGIGVLTLSNSAVAAFPDGLRLGSFSASSGTVNVQSGATLSAGQVVVGSDANAGAVAAINVTGGTVTQTGASTLTVGLSSAIDAPDIITVGSGGTFSTGTGTIGINTSGRLNIAGGTFNANGNLSLSGIASLTASGTLTSGPTSTTTLNAGGVLNITDSTANLGNITLNGGSINFVSGVLSYTGNLAVGTGGLLGNNLTLDFSRDLTLTGTTTINPQRQLALTGGSLTTANIVNNGTFNFTSGTLNLTGPAGLTIGAGGALGTTVSATTGKTFNITNLTTVSSTGTLLIADGTFNAAGGITNSGEIKLAGLVPSLTGGALTNAKLIRGDGRIDNNVTNSTTGELRAESGKTLLLAGTNGTNAGKINLQGGTVQFTNPLTNGTTGTITGTGFLYTDGGLTNNGQLQFSAGFTSVYGNVTNNNKITVTGGGTATFYNDLVMSPASTFQTSTNSTSVFFGTVTGSGIFTGPGTKDFEGGSGSLLRLGTVTGSTRVGPATVLELGSFDEASVIIEGALLLTPGQNLSRTALLYIDLTATFDQNESYLLIDYPATDPSPLETIRAYLATGRNAGAWNGPGLSSSTANTFNTAAGQELTSIAILDNATNFYSTLRGAPADTTSLLLRYTYTGDTNLDGILDGTDLANLIEGLSTGSTGWQNGDFNYDGLVNLADFGLFTTAYNAYQLNPVPLGSPTDVGPSSGGSIPEPAALAFVIPAALIFSRRRPAELGR